jgi:hypothetical protein
VSTTLANTDDRITSFEDYARRYTPNAFAQALGVVDYGQYQNWGYWDGYYPYPRPITITHVTLNGHRVCACPKCAGDCCDCKVKRLEARVAELEGK